MTIRFMRGNLLDDDADALVVPVNCVGIAGAGLALAFKRKFPENFVEYKLCCLCGDLKPGGVFTFASKKPNWIYNVATKNHWRNPSDIAWIERGLNELNHRIHADGILSIAIPALGCGNGGLDWTDVKPLIERYMNIPSIDTRVYEPKEA